MNIANLCYELYKIDWMSRISSERQINALCRYYDIIITEELSTIEYPFTKYLNEYGYGGEIYVCFNEFYDCEFKDVEYMKSLLTDDLFKDYLLYIKEN